jgi:glutamate-1-semialdehyde aminotransferase
MSNIWHRAQNSIAQGALTNSKHPEMHILGVYPTHIKYGHGAHLYDNNNQRYVDYICGLGANFMGYGNDKINQEIMKHLYGGYSHSLPTFHEVEAAEALKSVFPFVDQWKFTKTGSAACDAAIRIARTYTGRSKVLSEGYHGCSDLFVSLTPPALGVTDRHEVEKFTSLDQITSDVAAVIVEPIITTLDTARIDWLNALRVKCSLHGVVLIFDEIITGFRWKKYSVANAYAISPDLICVGKALANGMPLAAVGGKKELMSGKPYFWSTTYAGEVLSLVAAKKVIDMLHKESKYNVDYLWEAGEEFCKRFNEMSAKVKISGYGTRGVFEGAAEDIAIFFQDMARSNVLFCKSWFFNWDLMPHTESVLSIAREVVRRIDAGEGKLEYPLPKSPFSAEVRKQ